MLRMPFGIKFLSEQHALRLRAQADLFGQRMHRCARLICEQSYIVFVDYAAAESFFIGAISATAEPAGLTTETKQ
jgi:hypothetical protein